MKIALSLKKEFLFDLIPRANTALIVCAACLGAYLAFSLVRPHEYSELSRRISAQTGSQAGSRSLRTMEARPVFAEGTFKAKYLFSSVTKKAGEQNKKDFQLLGISVGAKNLAMIRDTRNNKDYYCAVGDAIGALRVKEIARDKVVLESPDGLIEINR